MSARLSKTGLRATTRVPKQAHAGPQGSCSKPLTAPGHRGVARGLLAARETSRLPACRAAAGFRVVQDRLQGEAEGACAFGPDQGSTGGCAAGK